MNGSIPDQNLRNEVITPKIVLSFRITYDDGFVWYADTESWFNLSSPKGDVTRDDTTIFSATQGSNVETILQPFKPM